MTNRWCTNLFVRPILLASVIVASSGSLAFGEDLAGTVAKAREQTENGAFADALRTLASLSKADLPPALAVEAGLLEATAALVTRGEGAGQQACAKAVIASGYDPEVARDQSPKVRSVCRAAAEKVRKDRIEKAGVKLGEISVATPDVAWKPIRITAEVEKAPAWLRVVARVRSTGVEGSFDLPLAPSPEGPLHGTLDPSFIRPGTTLDISLVAQDKFGDLAVSGDKQTVAVPKREALIVFGYIPSSARITVDDKAVDPDDSGRVAVSPGKHSVAMEVDGASASTSVEVERGMIASVVLSPQKGAGRSLAWIATGTSAVLLAAGGVFLGIAVSRTAEIEELAARREPGTNLPATDYADIKTRDDERRLFTNVGIGLAVGGGVIGAAAVTLWLLPANRGKPAPKKDASLFHSIQPQIGIGSVGLSGQF